MSDFEEQVVEELRRIQDLELAQQPEAFAQLRETLEKSLDSNPVIGE